MIVDGVNFIDVAIKSMTKEEFIAKHINVFYQDIGKKERKVKLADIYDRIQGKNKKSE